MLKSIVDELVTVWIVSARIISLCRNLPESKGPPNAEIRKYPVILKPCKLEDFGQKTFHFKEFHYSVSIPNPEISGIVLCLSTPLASIVVIAVVNRLLVEANGL